MDFYNSILIVWMVSSIFITGISSCNISFSTNSALFVLGENVTLTCKACTIGEGVQIKHNSTEIASYRLNIQLINATLHSAVGQTFGNGSVEVKLTILNFIPSSNGIYNCSTSSSDFSTLTLAYTVSTSPPDDDLSTYRKVALAVGIIDLAIGLLVPIVGLLVPIVTCPWVITPLYKADAGKEGVKCDIIIKIVLFMVWDLLIISSGSVLISNLNSEKGFKEWRIIYSLVCGSLCWLVLVAVLCTLTPLIISPIQRNTRTETEFEQHVGINLAAGTSENIHKSNKTSHRDPKF